MRRAQGHENERADLKPLICNSFLKVRGDSIVGVPVTDVERFLGLVRLPGWSILNWRIRICGNGALFSPDYSPFNFVGVFLVDDDVDPAARGGRP